MIGLMLLCILSSDFEQTELAFRKEREARLVAEDGWLNLAGLVWLEQGTSRFGTDPNVEVVLPQHATVAVAGTLTREGDTVRFKMARAQLARINGEIKREGELELTSPPTVLEHNNLRMFLIRRGDRIGLRIRDLRSPVVTEFKGLTFYKPRTDMVVQGRFEPFDPPRDITVPTVVDTETTFRVPGVIHFSIEDEAFSLLPFQAEEGGELFIIFKDLTAGRTTYPPGRFLYADAPQSGIVTLNFNRAVNPPCAYTPFATCPLPPKENYLAVAIEAGEKYLAADH